MFDLLNDGTAEILITMRHSMQEPGPNPSKHFTKIYTQDNIVSAEKEKELQVGSYLYQNYPNPFNSMTQIKFVLTEPAPTLITVYNLLGEKIKQFLKKDLPAGEHSVFWNGLDENGYSINSGIYFIKLNAGKYQETIKSILLK
jgi:flagellar hook assembly protein FlgD